MRVGQTPRDDVGHLVKVFGLTVFACAAAGSLVRRQNTLADLFVLLEDELGRASLSQLLGPVGQGLRLLPGTRPSPIALERWVQLQ